MLHFFPPPPACSFFVLDHGRQGPTRPPLAPGCVWESGPPRGPAPSPSSPTYTSIHKLPWLLFQGRGWGPLWWTQGRARCGGRFFWGAFSAAGCHACVVGPRGGVEHAPGTTLLCPRPLWLQPRTPVLSALLRFKGAGVGWSGARGGGHGAWAQPSPRASLAWCGHHPAAPVRCRTPHATCYPPSDPFAPTPFPQTT